MSKLIDYPAEEIIRLHGHLKTMAKDADDAARTRFASQHLMDFIGDLPILDEVMICECAEAGDADGVKSIIESNPDVEVYPSGDAPRHADDGWRMKSLALETANVMMASMPSRYKTPKQRAMSRACRPMFLKRYSGMPFDAAATLLRKRNPEKAGMCAMMEFYRAGIAGKVGGWAADAFMSRLASFMRSSIGRADEEQRMLTIGYILQYLDVVRLATEGDRVADAYIKTIFDVVGTPKNDGSDSV
jgi:hypothetical protein